MGYIGLVDTRVLMCLGNYQSYQVVKKYFLDAMVDCLGYKPG